MLPAAAAGLPAGALPAAALHHHKKLKRMRNIEEIAEIIFPTAEKVEAVEISSHELSSSTDTEKTVQSFYQTKSWVHASC